MDTNEILDQAEQRVSATNTQRQTTHAQVIEAMRNEIGPHYYAEAKAQLPTLDRALANKYLPFLRRVTAIAAKAHVPPPTQVQGWLREISTACDFAAEQVRNGITGYEKLQVPIWKDGSSIDLTVRSGLVFGIRQDLRSWDGKLSYLEGLKVQIERYIADSGWPNAASQAPGPMTTTPGSEQVDGVTVEI